MNEAFGDVRELRGGPERSSANSPPWVSAMGWLVAEVYVVMVKIFRAESYASAGAQLDSQRGETLNHGLRYAGFFPR